MKIKLISLFILLSFSNCSEMLTVTKSSLSDGCISPTIDFAYPMYAKKDSEETDDRVYPLKPWESISEVPVNNTANNGFGSIMFARNINGINEIWLKKENQFMIFRESTNSWEIVNSQIKDTNKNPQRIFLDKSGAIWGVGQNGFDYKDIPVFSRYNEDKKIFELIEDNVKTRISNSYFLRTPVLDNKGTFWLIINNNQIYNFNPYTNLSQIYFDNSFTQLSDLVWREDNNMFMLSTGLEESILIQFNIKNKSLNKIPILLKSNKLYPFSSLFIDNKSNLWFHDYGWMNKEDNWYEVVSRSSVFVSDRSESQYQYVWENPNIVFESSNDLLWFNSSAGLIWLDAESGTWCKVSIFPSAVTEDSQGNIWILSYEKLYKYSIQR